MKKAVYAAIFSVFMLISYAGVSNADMLTYDYTSNYTYIGDALLGQSLTGQATFNIPENYTGQILFTPSSSNTPPTVVSWTLTSGQYTVTSTNYVLDATSEWNFKSGQITSATFEVTNKTTNFIVDVTVNFTDASIGAYYFDPYYNYSPKSGTWTLVTDPVPDPPAKDPVPEPYTIILLSLGLAGLTGLRRKFKK